MGFTKFLHLSPLHGWLSISTPHDTWYKIGFIDYIITSLMQKVKYEEFKSQFWTDGIFYGCSMQVGSASSHDPRLLLQSVVIYPDHDSLYPELKYKRKITKSSYANVPSVKGVKLVSSSIGLEPPAGDKDRGHSLTWSCRWALLIGCSVHAKAQIQFSMRNYQ